MIEFYDISNWIWQDWNKPPKGTRAQAIIENPQTGDIYYFKQSKENYPSEIWSEIIASKFGQMIGFNVLDYNIAAYEQKLGCLSKSMIVKSEGETLYHGVDVLNDFIEEFEISNKPTYSFQNLQQICSQNEVFEGFMDNFIEIILFDAVIGNTDRHTENWALIMKISIEFERKKNIKPSKSINKLLNLLRKIVKFIAKREFDLNLHANIKSEYLFSPIYDSGSCLGREIAENEITNFLNDKQRTTAYINRGKSEILWYDKRLNLFQFIQEVEHTMPETVKKIATKMFAQITDEKIDLLVQNADNCLLGKNHETYLTFKRKILIQTLLKQRLKFLKETIHID